MFLPGAFAGAHAEAAAEHGLIEQMANMLEGGGKTPILPPEELQDMGFKLVAYPMSLLAVSIQAMESALEVRGYLLLAKREMGEGNVARGLGDKHSMLKWATHLREWHPLGHTHNLPPPDPPTQPPA